MRNLWIIDEWVDEDEMVVGSKREVTIDYEAALRVTTRHGGPELTESYVRAIVNAALGARTAVKK